MMPSNQHLRPAPIAASLRQQHSETPTQSLPSPRQTPSTPSPPQQSSPSSPQPSPPPRSTTTPYQCNTSPHPPTPHEILQSLHPQQQPCGIYHPHRQQPPIHLYRGGDLRHPRRKRIIPQRIPHGPWTAVQEIAQRQVRGVAPRWDLAEQEEHPLTVDRQA